MRYAKGLVFLASTLITGSLAFAEEITIQQSVIDTLRYAPRLEMIKSNQEAVGYDLDKSKGLWYPKLDVQGGFGTDSFSSKATRAEDKDNDWDRRAEAGAYLTQRLYDGGEASSQIRLDEPGWLPWNTGFLTMQNPWLWTPSLLPWKFIANVNWFFWQRKMPKHTATSWALCKNGKRPELAAWPMSPKLKPGCPWPKARCPRPMPVCRPPFPITSV